MRCTEPLSLPSDKQVDISAKLAGSSHPFRMRLAFLLFPVVSLADSLNHRLQIYYPFGISKAVSRRSRVVRATVPACAIL